MNNSTFSLCSNVFGFVVGSLSLLGFVVAGFRPHLPSNKIKMLDALLHETEGSLKEAVEDGLLMHDFTQRIEQRLAALERQTCSLRSRAYNIITIRQDYSELLKGTSTAIGPTCRLLKELRAEVITSSEEGRRKLSENQMNLTDSTSPRQPALELDPEFDTVPEHLRSSSPPTEIPHPHSCPPVFATLEALPVLARSSEPPLTSTRDELGSDCTDDTSSDGS